jgi:hypothetical protein
MEDKDMTWKTTVEEATTAAAEGEFDAEVTGIEDRDGQHGPMVRIEFKLATDDDGDERRVTGLASKKLSENTKLGRWIAAIIGHMPAVGEEITMENLLHKHCRVEIKHKTSPDGRTTFANVADVLPVPLSRLFMQ